MFERVDERFGLARELAEALGVPGILQDADFLRSRILRPESYVVLLGETSSGKSTLLNGLLGERELVTSVTPSTAAVVEVKFADTDTLYSAFRRGAPVQLVERAEFERLQRQPDAQLQRLQIAARPGSQALPGMRLFDTPGYGSLTEKYEEILGEFIPNSDVVLYVVSYRVGIQQDDYAFLAHARRLLADDTQVFLAVNMCPKRLAPNDARIREIRETADGVFQFPVPFFTIPYERTDAYPLPAAGALWRHVRETVTSPAHQQRLEEALNNLTRGLYAHCERIILATLAETQLRQEDREFLRRQAVRIWEAGEGCKQELILPAFQRLGEVLPRRLEQAKRAVLDKAAARIDGADRLSEDETASFITGHLLHFETRRQTDDLLLYLRSSLGELDRQVRARLLAAQRDARDSVRAHFPAASYSILEDLLGGGSRRLEQEFLSYCRPFSENGVPGISNAIKHLSGRKGGAAESLFSRETNSALSHTLSKIGAASARAVGTAVSFILDGIMMTLDAFAWQSGLEKAVARGLDQWYDQASCAIAQDLGQLCRQEIRLVDGYIDQCCCGLKGLPSSGNVQQVDSLRKTLISVRERWEALDDAPHAGAQL